MTVATEIVRIQGVKSNILDAIAAKGVTVPSGAKLADCPGLIASITGGGEFDLNNIVPIVPVPGIYVVDANGYIGYDITKYFQYNDATVYRNFALLCGGNDFSQMRLGQVTFTPASTDYIGGRLYPTVTIGGTTWMAENLDFKFSGLVVGSAGTSAAEPRGNYYGNDEAGYGEAGNRYGLMYNWVAVKYLEDNKSLLIPGWHVPTAAEWNALINAIGSTIAGTRLKSTTGWDYSGWEGDDFYGFCGFPAGNYDGAFRNKGSYAEFWTITESGTQANAKDLRGSRADVGSSTWGKNNQLSLRLIKDSP